MPLLYLKYIRTFLWCTFLLVPYSLKAAESVFIGAIGTGLSCLLLDCCKKRYANLNQAILDYPTKPLDQTTLSKILNNSKAQKAMLALHERQAKEKLDFLHNTIPPHCIIKELEQCEAVQTSQGTTLTFAYPLIAHYASSTTPSDLQVYTLELEQGQKRERCDLENLLLYREQTRVGKNMRRLNWAQKIVPLITALYLVNPNNS